MPWPEKDMTTRVLAGIAGAAIGAFIGFLLGVGAFAGLNHGHPPLAAFVIGAASVSFLICFWVGDPAVRFVMRLLGGWRVR
jgi:hypothetical protein